MYIVHVQSDFWYNHEKFCDLVPIFLLRVQEAMLHMWCWDSESGRQLEIMIF